MARSKERAAPAKSHRRVPRPSFSEGAVRGVDRGGHHPRPLFWAPKELGGAEHAAGGKLRVRLCEAGIELDRALESPDCCQCRLFAAQELEPAHVRVVGARIYSRSA
jgi:hypothetical protein